MAYDFSKLGDVNTERTIPDGSEVTAILSGPAEAGTTPNGSPFVQCEYQVRGGAFDSWKLRTALWLNQTVKPDSKSGKSAFEISKEKLNEMYRGYIYVPEASYSKGKETPESAAKRAPYLGKMNQFFGIVDGDAALAKKVSQFVGKPVTLKVRVKPDKNGVPRNEVAGFVAIKTPAPA